MKSLSLFSKKKKNSQETNSFTNLQALERLPQSDFNSNESSEYDENGENKSNLTENNKYSYRHRRSHDHEDQEREHGREETEEPIYNLPITVWNGSILWKIPYNGRGLAEKRYVRIKKAPRSGDNAVPIRIISRNHLHKNEIYYLIYPFTIVWSNPEKVDDINNSREVSLDEALELLEGYDSQAFLKHLETKNPLPPEQLCFSIITKIRTIDFAAENLDDALVWKRCLHDLIQITKTRQGRGVSQKKNKLSTKLKSSQSLPIEGKKPNTSLHNKESSRQQFQQTNWKELNEQFFHAIRNNDYPTVEYLLNIKKITINQMDSQYLTPLMIACEQNSGQMTRLCLDHEARIDEFPEPFPTALHSAARSRSFECMSLLIQSSLHHHKLELLLNRRDSDGNTALHISSYYGDANIIELLICNGADMTIEDSFGRNALHLASLYGSRRSLMILLDQGGDTFLDYTDSKGYTPLHYCAEGGYEDCVELLLGAAADPSLVTFEGYSSFTLAAQNNHQRICHILQNYTNTNTPTSEDDDNDDDDEEKGEDDVSLPQSEVNTYLSSLSKGDTTARSEENDGKFPMQLSAARALQLAMSNSERVSNDEETPEQRAHQLYLLDHGLFPTNVETESQNISLPIEEFQYNDCLWQIYHTEDGYIYYLNSATNYSQWDDPRVVGIIDSTEQQQQYQQQYQEEEEPEFLSSSNISRSNSTLEEEGEEQEQDRETSDIQSSASTNNQKNGKKFTKPRQINSPLHHQTQNYSPQNAYSSDSYSSPRPIVDKRNPSTAGKIAWMGQFTPPPPSSPSQPLFTSPSKNPSSTTGEPSLAPSQFNTFSPNRSSVDRAKSLQKNVPFPLSSPPQSLRVAALKARYETDKSNTTGRETIESPTLRESWASPSKRQIRSKSSPSVTPSRASPQSSTRNRTPSKEVDKMTNEHNDVIGKQFSQEDLIKSKSFEFRDGSYGCGGNTYGI